jgi:hypothetical protein
MSLVVDFVGPEMEPRIRRVRSKQTILDGGKVRFRRSEEPGQTYRVPDEMVRRMHDLPTGPRLSDRAKFENLLQQLITDARTMFLRDGVVHWPASIKKQLMEMGWKEGKPNMWNEVEMLARRYVVATANRQKERDGKHVTT